MHTSLGKLSSTKSNHPSLHWKKSDQDQENCTLYVYNLNEEVTTRQLESIFENFGPLKRVHSFHATYSMITFHYKKDAVMALTQLNGTKLQERTMRITIAHNKEKVWLNQSKHKAKKQKQERNDFQSDDNKRQLSVKVSPQNYKEKSKEKVGIQETDEMWEEEKEFDIDKKEMEDDQDNEETQLKIIDDAMDYFDQHFCMVHPQEESVEKIEIHQPTTPTRDTMNAWCTNCGNVLPSKEIFEHHKCDSTQTSSSVSSTTFNEFDNVTYQNSYKKEKEKDERRQEFNNNALQIFAMSKVSISPYTESSVRVELIQTTSSDINPLSEVDGIIIMTGGLSPYPQIQDGIYQVTNSSLTIIIKNNSNKDMIIKRHEIIRGVDVHTWKFVRKSMSKQEGISIDMDHFNLNHWHLEAKAFKNRNEEEEKLEQLKYNNN